MSTELRIVNPSSNMYRHYTSQLLEPDIFRQSSGKFRPSEASAEVQMPYGKQVLGSCARKTFYRMTGATPTSAPPLPYQINRMRMGNFIEKSICEDLERAGIIPKGGRNIKFHETMQGVEISGEIDAIVRTEPCGDCKACAEIKSMAGYPAQKDIFGKKLHGKQVGIPRDSYLMQLGLYLYKFSRLPEDHPAYLPFGVVFINDRGDGHYCSYDVWLERETRLLSEGESQEFHRLVYKSDDLGVPRTMAPFSIEDIIARYKLVEHYISKGSPPPRDFIREYNREQVETFYKAGKITANKYKQWQSAHGPRGKKKFKLGDWHCFELYCPYTKLCWDISSQ